MHKGSNVLGPWGLGTWAKRVQRALGCAWEYTIDISYFGLFLEDMLGLVMYGL